VPTLESMGTDPGIFQKGAKRGGMANNVTQKLKKNVELLCKF